MVKTWAQNHVKSKLNERFSMQMEGLGTEILLWSHYKIKKKKEMINSLKNINST